MRPADLTAVYENIGITNCPQYAEQVQLLWAWVDEVRAMRKSRARGVVGYHPGLLSRGLGFKSWRAHHQFNLI